MSGYNAADADCHYGDHFWAGTSQCTNCYARLRCTWCHCYLRQDNIEKHMNECPRLLWELEELKRTDPEQYREVVAG